MDEIKFTERKIEAFTGIYDASVVKFIYQVLVDCRSNPLTIGDLIRTHNWEPSFPSKDMESPYLPIQSDKVEVPSLYPYKKDTIKSLRKKIFKTNIAFSEKNNAVFPRVIFLTNDVKNVLPEGYRWMDDGLMFERCILPIAQLDEVIKTDINHFREIHLFLLGFQYYLENCVVPSLLENRYPEIEKLISIPISIAFRKELSKTKYSFNHFLMKEISPKEMNYLNSLKLTTIYLCQFLPELTKSQVEFWLKNFGGADYQLKANLFMK